MCSATPEVEEEVQLEVDLDEGWKIVLFNDDHNTFDHVIQMLMKIVGHDALQAEQCAVIVHFKGKCDVKHGSYEDLEPLCTALLEADLTAEIQA
jgi:ATP-dependent Clp protease adaptor protein ClpS